MKKKLLAIIAIIVLAISLSISIVACDKNEKEELEYSVTVLSPDKTPLSDITVNFVSGDKVVSTAQTDKNGKAAAVLKTGTYTIVLADYDEKLDYTPFSLNPKMLSARVTLSVKRVTYTITVKDKNGAPAHNVSVTFMSDNKIVDNAQTDANGIATKELDYGEYIVNVANLPEGNLSDGNKTVTGSNPSAEFNLRDSSNVEVKDYTVTVMSEGGLLFTDTTIFVYDGDDLLAFGNTDKNGEYKFSYEAGNYTVIVEDIPDGYSPAEAELTSSNNEVEIKLHSEAIKAEPDPNTRYVIGDIIHDYEFTTPYNMENGKPWSGSISEILKTKKAIIINNWGLNCSWCVTEMPDMQEVYEKYSDQIEMIGVNNFSNLPDTDKNIQSFQESKNITFPMMRDTYGLSVKFGITNWPTTVIIDRYGAIARIEVGAVLGTEAWERMILKYIGNDYVQTFTPGDRVSDSINNEVSKPDVEVPEDHYTTQVPGVLHNTSTFPANTVITWRAETEYEYAWPFVIGEDANISETQYLYASNIGKPSTMAIIYADITVNAGHVLTFEYYADSEEKDILNFVWDGKIIHKISGPNQSKGWQTCYLYSELTDGDHTLAIAYIKNSSGNVGKDNVYIRNLHFVDIESIAEADEPIDMLRGAAYGQLKAGDTKFPHYAEVYLDENDGFYHVRLDSLQNSALAGNDENPLLLVNLLNVTTWSPKLSINQLVLGVNEAGEYVTDCSFALSDGVIRDYRAEITRYLSAASASDVDDMAPVDQRLHDLLFAFMSKLSGQYWHPNEWLEVCFYYSHYGSGEPIGNPIMGLMTETAIPIEEDTLVTADLTRMMAPFPTMIYSFTPTETGLYKFESFIPDKDAEQYWAQIWLYDDDSDPDHAIKYSGDSRINLNGKNEQNFELYCRLEANHKYYVEVAFGMNEMGTYEFSVKRVHEDVIVWEPASADTYQMVLAPDGELTQQYILSRAVNYELYTDGYYRVKNEDGSWGDYIYLDVLRVGTSALGSIPLNRLVAMEYQDPVDYTKGLGYGFFDFRYCIMYYNYEVNGEQYTGYLPKVDLQSNGERYKDYTEILQGYINSAPTEGDYEGLIKVNEELADILKMFFELRLNGVWAEVSNNNGVLSIDKYEIETALENEWLRFCWYQKTYKADNE